ncbi:hypothetical protein TCAL_16966 [Tigriopus californicus]|uniref:Uncharacterized protein n=1 Tax=Tigriopus californicus TaxID=6832 RepID=A0A553PFK3_TIGCA|nr:hypothetical protein TCAL_16966 [Tigriopus californicus]
MTSNASNDPPIEQLVFDHQSDRGGEVSWDDFQSFQNEKRQELEGDPDGKSETFLEDELCELEVLVETLFLATNPHPNRCQQLWDRVFQIGKKISMMKTSALKSNLVLKSESLLRQLTERGFKKSSTPNCGRTHTRQSRSSFTQGNQEGTSEHHSPNLTREDLIQVLDSVQAANKEFTPSDMRRKLSVPKFSGKEDFDNWLARFDTLVHRDSRIDNSGKLLELHAALEGQARCYIEDIIAGNFDGSSYEAARKLLLKCYGGPTRRRAKYHKNFDEMKPLKSYNAVEIRGLYSKMEGLYRMISEDGDENTLVSTIHELTQKALGKLGIFVKDYSVWCQQQGWAIHLKSIRMWLESFVDSSSAVDTLTPVLNLSSTGKHSFSLTSKPHLRRDKPSSSSSSSDTDDGCGPVSLAKRLSFIH